MSETILVRMLKEITKSNYQNPILANLYEKYGFFFFFFSDTVLIIKKKNLFQ